MHKAGDGRLSVVALVYSILAAANMSYAGYEYGGGGGYGGYGGGGFDPMSGLGGFGMGGMGGGFMSEEGNKGGKSSEKKSRDKQNFTPVTVHQILTAKKVDDVYRVDDNELYTVKLIGFVSNLTFQSTNISFQLNDGSGSIDCRFFISKDDSSSSADKLKAGHLVKVVGNIREYDNKIHMSIFEAYLVQDWNELTHHILDTIFTHLQNTKGAIPGSEQPAQPAASFNSYNASTPVAANRGFNSQPTFQAPGMSLNNNFNNARKEDKLVDDIFRAYMTGIDNQTGLSFSEVLQILKNRGIMITKDQLVRVVSQLCEEGRLYTTIDEEYYRPTTEDYN